ncbi:P-loop containing nucleoside triphosphate hydrolase protein [Lactarius quietus]|nr:P-loop containing nucleoside triphosphate hydrolase protein [Lactarius quietus]
MNTRTRAKPAANATRSSTRTTRATSQLETSAPTGGAPSTVASSKVPISRVVTETAVPTDAEREPIKAFLRIRPDIGGDESRSAPYLEGLSETAVRMLDPSRDDAYNYSGIPRFRLSATPTSSIYTFTHVFPPNTQQTEFFVKTTLPLVRSLLDGEDGLLFAYGVTNSGKTYTMQGGSHESSAGILPRTIDVLFNSVEGLQGSSKYRPARLNGIELNDPSSIFSRAPSLDNFTLPSHQPVLGDVIADHFESTTGSEADRDSTTLKVDRNYEYSIWLSYAEVYNERIYDLLTNVEGPGASSSRTQPILLTRKALSMKPAPPSDNLDAEGPAGKYISGLTHVRVDNAKEAKRLVKLGQLHRRVFGTLANSQSSRSHGIVTIKLSGNIEGERSFPTSIQEPNSYITSRLTLIDLAGSERSKHTQATGERLKEAGNINKSLMVLGQCIEVMRANQKRVAQSLAASQSQRSDTRDVKKSLAVVPFRHSKLTEILMDYFTGEGRVTMIININPYDTGFDENSSVMKFAALAREVSIAAPIKQAPPPGRTNAPTGDFQPTRPREPHHRKVVLSTSRRGERKFSETQLDVVEGERFSFLHENQDADVEDGSDEEPMNGLVEALFDEIERLRLQLFESEMRSAVIEAETREEVMREMEGRILEIEKRFTRRLMNEVELNEMRMDAKIDMLHRSGMIGQASSKVETQSGGRDSTRVTGLEEPREDDSSEDDRISKQKSLRSRAESPLAGRAKTQTEGKRAVTPPRQSYSVLHSYDGKTNKPDERDDRVNLSLFNEEEEGESDESGGDGTPKTESDVSDEWVPASSRPLSTTAIAQNASLPHLDQAPSPIFEKDVKAGRTQARPGNKTSVSELARDLGGLDLSHEKASVPEARASQQSTRMPVVKEEEDSIIVVPNAKAGDGQKKKKR